MQQLQKQFEQRQPLHIIPDIIKLEDEDPVTVQDQSRLQEMIGSLKHRIEDLIAEIYELTIEKERDHSEHEVILQRLREDHNRFVTETERYRVDISNIEELYQQDKERFELEKERERRSIETNRAAEMLQLQKRIEELSAVYQQQHQFEVMEREYKEQIAQLTQVYTEAQYRHHDAMNFEEKKQTKQNENVRSRNQLTKKDTLKNAHVDAEREVIQEQKQAMAHNLQLKEKLLEYEKELERVKKEREAVARKNRQMKINASISLEGLEEYKAVGALQIAKIKAFKDKVESMKATIAEQLAAKSKHLQQVNQKHTDKIAQLQRQLERARQQHSIKCKHLTTLKQLAETILQQRAQVEQFFLTAMQHVGSQAKQISRDNMINRAYKDKVDVSELDAIDKQKILRTLFTRVSMGSKKDMSS